MTTREMPPATVIGRRETYDAPPAANDGAHVTSDEREMPPWLDDEPPDEPAPPWDARVIAVPSEWYSAPPPRREWLLRDARRPNADGVLPLGKVGQLVAEGGAGKTQLLLQLAIAVATGTRFLGALDVCTPGPVLLALGEEDAEEAHRRLYRGRRATGAPIPKPGAIVVLPLVGVTCALVEADENGNPRDTAFAVWLRAMIVERGPWSLIVVDPLSRFAGKDAETDNAAGTRYVQALESIAATGPTVLGAHHTNKLSRGKGGRVEAHGARGSSSIVDGSRWVATLTREELEHEDPTTRERLGEVVTLSFAKSNYSRRGDPIALRFDGTNGGALLPLDDTDRAIVESTRGVEPARVERQRMRDAERTEHESDEDRAVLQAVRERPGIPLRDLVKRVQAIAHCGASRAEVAIARMSPTLDVREGPRKARLHHLRGKDE